ncbi:MAG: GGDEF domain-containing protein [Syntrophobacteraceae bacterium]
MSKRDIQRSCPPPECPNVEHCSLAEEVKLLRERCLKLEELSFVDGLTGLYNFRYMQIALEMEMERTRRTKLPTGLIMLDIDHFKDFNTRYGHEGGNAALAALGKLLKESVRVIDIPCRYGGEEFAVILPNAFHKQAVSIAERLHELVQSCSVDFKGQSLSFTASFGVAVFNRFDQETLSSFISRADNLLYDAKQAGRDRVCSDQSCLIPMAEEVTAEEKSALFSSDEN